MERKRLIIEESPKSEHTREILNYIIYHLKYKQKNVEVQICLEFDFNLASVSNLFFLRLELSLALWKPFLSSMFVKWEEKFDNIKKVISHKNMNTQK